MVVVVRKVVDDIYYVGVDDNLTRFFESIWPIPEGISYNTYLIRDQKNVLIEGGVKKYFSQAYIDALRGLIDLKELGYIIVNHSEPDHTGSLPLLLELSNAKVIVSKFGAMLLKNFYGIPQDRMIIVGNNDTLDIGKRELRFVLTPGAHWPDSMVTYSPTDKILFSQDIFGSFGRLNGKIFDFEVDMEFYLMEMKRYFINIIGKFVSNAKRALDALSRLDIAMMAPSHGVIWEKYKDNAIALYKDLIEMKTDPKKITLLYGSMYGFSEEIAYIIAQKLLDRGFKVRVINVTETHPSHTLLEIWDSKIIILGSPTYDNGAFPPMLMHVMYFKIKGIKNKKYAIFGSSGWSGGGYRELEEILSSLGWSRIDPVVEYRGKASKGVIEKIDKLIDNIVAEMGEQ